MRTTTLRAFPEAEYREIMHALSLNVIERLWRVVRRRATHNRLFATMATLRRALRASPCYYQTLRHKVLSLIRAPKKVAQSGAAWMRNHRCRRPTTTCASTPAGSCTSEATRPRRGDLLR